MQKPGITVYLVEDGISVEPELRRAPLIAVLASRPPNEKTLDDISAASPRVVAVCCASISAIGAIRFIKQLRERCPAPVIVTGTSPELALQAKSAGAYEYMFRDPDYKKYISNLLFNLRIAATANSTKPVVLKAYKKDPSVPFSTTFNGVIALGASCGGTEATSTVLKKLPANLPGMVIAQHMPPVFTKMYADRLHRECALSVCEAADGMHIQRGNVYIAPGDLQMGVEKRAGGFSVRVWNGEKVSGHRPSVDVLFDSVAKAAGGNAVGILLTGMGSDGAKGLLSMRQSGAFTIGQNEESSLVYGMPKVAYTMGAVEVQTHLDTVSDVLLGHLSKL